MTASPNPSAFDTTLTSRYECKYLIDESRAHAIRRYLQSYATLDPYSRRQSDARYRVLSLYFDSPGLHLYRDTVQGVRNRFKLRLRYYEERGRGPVFFEVKKRSNVIVRKSRACVARDRAEAYLSAGVWRSAERPEHDLGEFLERCRETGAQPALRIRYWREAWESRSVDPVRITFDTEVEHCLLSSSGLAESRPEWCATPAELPVILEVKFTDLRPSWLDRMLQRFELDKISIAKYAESVEEVVSTGGLEALQARMALGRRDSARGDLAGGDSAGGDSAGGDSGRWDATGGRRSGVA